MDDLRNLLRTHQGTVYNLCFQVLRNGHDAEDAAQEALFEIVRGAGSVREPRAFKRWLCRVALHTALDHLRRRDRRWRHEETRAAMKPLSPDPTAAAIHDALEKLDDDDRCLIVEKYFERATLEEIAAREGVSAAAVGKRVDRAKERLKQRLIQAGMASVVAGVDRTLEAAPAVTTAPDLLASAVFLESALAVGAVAVAKPSLPLLVGAGSLLFVLVAAGVGIGLRNRRTTVTPPAAFVQATTDRADLSDTDLSSVPPQQASSQDPAPDPGRTPDTDELRSRLDRFKKWLEDRNTRDIAGNPRTGFRLAQKELEGVRDLILANPTVFLEWLEAPNNAGCADLLVGVTLTNKSGPWEWQYSTQPFESFPSSLGSGLLRLLHTGNPDVRAAVLQFAQTLKDTPAAWRLRFLELVREQEDLLVSGHAAKALLASGDATPTESRAIVDLAIRHDDPHLIAALCRCSKPLQWLIDALETDALRDPKGRITVVTLEGCFAPEAGPDLKERGSRLLEAVMVRLKDSEGYNNVVSLALGLSLDSSQARSLLSLAASGAPTEKLRRSAGAILQRTDVDFADGPARRRAWVWTYHGN